MLTGCAWQQRSDSLRVVAAPQMGCPAADLSVFTRDDLGRVRGCKREALYILSSPNHWEMESMYPTNARDVAYVPRCGSPEVINFVSGEEEISDPHHASFLPPEKISGRKVRYPRGAAAQNIKGEVTAQCSLSSVGLISCCDLEEERALLDDEIRATLATWRFVPARVDGKAAAVRIPVRFGFELY